MKTNLNPKIFTKSVELKPTRHGYGEGLVEAGKRDKNVVVLCADVTKSTRSHLFKEKFPQRFFECGVAEQNMMGVAAGLAKEGKIPFVSSYAVFSPGRNWDQLRVNVCYNDVPVKIAGSHTGITVGADGTTHQGLEDIALTRVLPNLIVITPCDALEARKAVVEAIKINKPVYLRLAREKTPIITTAKTQFKMGKAEVFNSGTDVSIIAFGPLVYQALVAARRLAQEKISAEVINCHTIKPVDTKTIIGSVKKTGCLVTVEEHQIMAGAGSAVLEIVAENFPVPALRIGMRDTFGESGKPSELLEKYGMDAETIIQAAKKVLKRK